MTTYTLGPLPWSDETLTRAYWKGFTKAYETIREHPGYELHKRVESLKAALRLFNKWCARFHEDLGNLHVELKEAGILQRNRKDELKRFEESFQEALYVIASTAMTLVEQSRAIAKKIELAGYEDKTSAFANDPAHRFIQELRNDVIHVSLHQPSWQVDIRMDGLGATEMILHPHQFQRAKGWHSLAKQYLQNRPDGVRVGELISQYQGNVVHFHEWLHQAITEAKGAVIADYLRCDRTLYAIGSRATWRLQLSQIVIPNKKDPFAYLDRYLNAEEMEEINALPHRSAGQIDRIIEIIDEYGACDGELRELVYQAFSVSDSINTRECDR